MSMGIVFLIGRILFGGFFIMNGVNHFLQMKNMAAYSKSKGIPLPQAAVLATGALLVLGGLGIVLGMYIRFAVACLVLFLIPTTFMMHQYWKIQDPMARMGDQIHFMKNMALLGAALMLLAISTPWVFSLMDDMSIYY